MYLFFQSTETPDPVQVSGAVSRLVEVWDSLVAISPALLVSLIVFLVVASIGHFLAKWAGFWRLITRNMFLAEILSQAVRLAFLVLGLVLALEMMGAGNLIGAILGAAGITGIAIGFAVKDTVDNYVSSLMLSFNQPFRPNDFIEIEGLVGRVIRMTSRATILMTPDGNHLRIPNAKVYKSPIINYTRIPERRFEFSIGVKPSDDPQAAIQLGIAEISKLDFIKDDPEPNGHIMDMGPSTIDLTFRAWIDQGSTSFSRARSLALRAVKLALEDAGFSIPDPSYNITLSTLTPLLTDDVDDGIRQTPQLLEEKDIPIKLDKFDSNTAAKADHFIEEKVAEERKRLLETNEQEDMLNAERPEE
ncbi:MAG: mechanosensitive ion channel domain-containing protein [Litorimonas sp.]